MTVSYHSLEIQILAAHHIVSANEVNGNLMQLALRQDMIFSCNLATLIRCLFQEPLPFFLRERCFCIVASFFEYFLMNLFDEYLSPLEVITKSFEAQVDAAQHHIGFLQVSDLNLRHDANVILSARCYRYSHISNSPRTS